MNKQIRAPEVASRELARRASEGVTSSLARRANGSPTPLIEELRGTLAPWDVARKLAGCSHLLLLDSAAGPSALARYSYVTADPYAWLQSRGHEIRLNGLTI